MKESTVARPQWTYVVLVGLLMISSFLVGSLYTKVQYLQSGAAPAGNGAKAAKYKTFDDAMRALAKNAKLDANKLISCMNGGGKKDVVDKETAAGNELGVTGTPAFFINGRLLGGAFPYEAFKEIIDKELAGTGSDKATDYSKSLQDAAGSGAFDPKARQVNFGAGAVKGKADAPVKIVEFSDFQCPFCARAFPTIQQVQKEYGDKVVLVYRHLPLTSIHPRAHITAQASECARDQGKFWEFHDELFGKQTDWSSL